MQDSSNFKHFETIFDQPKDECCKNATYLCGEKLHIIRAVAYFTKAPFVGTVAIFCHL
jgi:hypothetical protein